MLLDDGKGGEWARGRAGVELTEMPEKPPRFTGNRQKLGSPSKSTFCATDLMINKFDCHEIKYEDNVQNLTFHRVDKSVTCKVIDKEINVFIVGSVSLQ